MDFLLHNFVYEWFVSFFLSDESFFCQFVVLCITSTITQCRFRVEFFLFSFVGLVSVDVGFRFSILVMVSDS